MDDPDIPGSDVTIELKVYDQDKCKYTGGGDGGTLHCPNWSDDVQCKISGAKEGGKSTTYDCGETRTTRLLSVSSLEGRCRKGSFLHS